MKYFFGIIKKLVFSYFATSALKSFERRKKYVQTFLKECPIGSRLIDVGAGTQRYREYA